MATTETGVYYPAGEDSFAPHSDMEMLAESLAGRTVVPVANATERTSVYNALDGAGHNFAAEPLIVDRLDTGNIERNAGAGWGVIARAPGGDVVTGTASAWPITSGAVRARGLYASMSGILARINTSNGSVTTAYTQVASIPTAFAPPGAISPFLNTGYNSAGQTFETAVTSGGAVSIRARGSDILWPLSASVPLSMFGTWPLV